MIAYVLHTWRQTFKMAKQSFLPIEKVWIWRNEDKPSSNCHVYLVLSIFFLQNHLLKTRHWANFFFLNTGLRFMARYWGLGNKAKNQLSSAKSLSNFSSLFLCVKKQRWRCLPHSHESELEAVWKEKVSWKTPKWYLYVWKSQQPWMLLLTLASSSSHCLWPAQRNSVWVGEQSSAFLGVWKSCKCIPLGKVL